MRVRVKFSSFKREKTKNKAKINQPFFSAKKSGRHIFLRLKKAEITGLLAARIIFSQFFHCELEVRNASQCEQAKTLASQRVCELESGSKPPLETTVDNKK